MIAQIPQLKRQARLFKALAHPGRLRIVQELSQGERCVCDLAKLLGVQMPTVSRHLALLREAGIVDDEKRGTQVFYRLRTPCVLKIFDCLTELERASDRKERSRAA